MRISSEGIIISVGKFSESSLIIDLLTSKKGRMRGMVRSAFSRKKGGSNIYQLGNIVNAEWSARLDSQLGMMQLTLNKEIFSHIIDDVRCLLAVNSLCMMIKKTIPFHETIGDLYDDISYFLFSICKQESNYWIVEYIKLEVKILALSGYGIDIKRCAVTGDSDNLNYVSPKSGRAVCDKIAEPYKARLLRLPKFLISSDDKYQDKYQHEKQDIIDGLKLTRYFFAKHFYPDESSFPYHRIELESRILDLHENNL